MRLFVMITLASFLTLGLLTPARADENKKRIALTFDDGPNTTTTGQVLDVLEAYGVPATFFLIGQNISAQSAENVRRAMSMGCEIACHSWAHSHMDRMTEAEIRADIEKSVEKIKAVTGEDPVYFRPPYIAVNSLMFDLIDMIFISGAGCNDWMPEVSAQERIDLALSAVRDGEILLLHDSAGNGQTVEALKTLIPECKKRGYELVTLSRLFEEEGVTPQKGVLYSNVRQ